MSHVFGVSRLCVFVSESSRLSTLSGIVLARAARLSVLLGVFVCVLSACLLPLDGHGASVSMQICPQDTTQTKGTQRSERR